MYDTNYRILLSDFLDATERTARTGETGTLGFAAPELVLGARRWDESVRCLVARTRFVLFGLQRIAVFGALRSERGSAVPRHCHQTHFAVERGTEFDAIDRLCRADPKQRQSLHSVIGDISDIFATTALSNHNFVVAVEETAITPSTIRCALAIENTNVDGRKPDLSQFPVVSYVPRPRKGLRWRSRKHREQRSLKVSE